MSALQIELPRLSLVAATNLLAQLAVQDPAGFASQLSAEVPPDWPPIVTSDPRPFFARVLAADPTSAGWWIWYIILREPRRILIGHSGFKGPPNAEGLVECGYAVLEAWQNRGYAAEALQGLVDWAFADERVRRVIGRTYPHLIASIRTMEKCHFRLTETNEQGIITYARERSPSNGQAAAPYRTP